MRSAAEGIRPRVHGVHQDLADAHHGRPPPFQIPAVGPVERANPQPDIVAGQVVEDAPDAADLLVFVENEADDVAYLLVGVQVDAIRGDLDIAQRHVLEEFAAPGLVQPATLQSIPHSNKLEFADRALQAEQEPVVGVLRIVHAVLVGEDRPEEGAHLQEIVPIPVVAGDAAHLDAED